MMVSVQPVSILVSRRGFHPKLLQDHRATDPERFAHLRQELGMEAWSGSEA